jgi:hypothetical protein
MRKGKVKNIKIQANSMEISHQADKLKTIQSMLKVSLIS